MDIVLIPGLWLDGPSWSEVAGKLEAAGHRPRPVTLPRAEGPAPSLDECVAAVLDHIADAGDVVVVGHSAGAGLAWAAADAVPDRIARLILVGGFPTPSGSPIVGGFESKNGRIDLPPWDAFDEADLAGLDDAALERFRARAFPSPAALTTEPLTLTDDRRFAVPTTVVCTEFSAVDLQGWVEAGMAPVQEVARMRHLEYVDLPTGHWPQFTRPAELAALIAERAYRPTIDEHDRIHPEPAASESMTALGFLDYQRATLAWKCRGLDRAGLSTMVGASTLTLGGLLKHMALVEDGWFSSRLWGRERSAPWNAVDWSADPDWEFTSSLDDDPEGLWDLWRTSVHRSRAFTAAALAAGGLNHEAAHRGPGGEPVTLRWIVTHMIEEYARHNGHADLLREAIDGEAGE